MSALGYVNGVLEPIPNPLEKIDITWGTTGEPWVSNDEDYAWMATLPGECMEGFQMVVYRAASTRAPYPLMATVGFSLEDIADDVYFASGEELTRYVKEHVALMQITVLANIAGRMDNAFEWLFDSDRGIFAGHVREQLRRERTFRQQREAERKRRTEARPDPITTANDGRPGQR